jgi:uncharacterized surface protein with fasciclin (FAS1) repeats
MRSQAVAALLSASLALAACGSHDGGGDPVKRVDPKSLEVADTEAAAEPDAILRVDEVVLRNPDLSTLSRAIKASDLAAALGADTPITLFAPDNGAFDKIGVDALAELLLPANKDRLATVLKYHVIPGRLTAADLRKRIGDSGGSVEIVTLQGEILTASVELDQVRLADASGKVASIALPDLQASNGMVHGIDTVLGPQL